MNEFDRKMYRTVAFNIAKYLKEKNLSLEDLCLNCQIKKKHLEEFLKENSNLTISIYDLYKISVILEVSIDKFFN